MLAALGDGPALDRDVFEKPGSVPVVDAVVRLLPDLFSSQKQPQESTP